MYYVGGIFENSKTTIREVPHVLTLNDTVALQEFLRVVAFSKVADELGIPYKYPDLGKQQAQARSAVASKTFTETVGGFFGFNFWTIATIAFALIVITIIVLVILSRSKKNTNKNQ